LELICEGALLEALEAPARENLSAGVVTSGDHVRRASAKLV